MMKSIAICPCCFDAMLHHIGSGKEYWFCRNCWQEMPNLALLEPNKHPMYSKPGNLSIGSFEVNSTQR